MAFLPSEELKNDPLPILVVFAVRGLSAVVVLVPPIGPSESAYPLAPGNHIVPCSAEPWNGAAS